MDRKSFLLTLLSTYVVTACGGGGSDSSEATQAASGEAGDDELKEAIAISADLTTKVVKNMAELNAAITSMSSTGGVIKLSPGVYTGRIGNAKPVKQVLIVGVTGAEFSSLEIVNSENLKFRTVKFSYVYNPDYVGLDDEGKIKDNNEFRRAVEISNSKGITLERCTHESKNSPDGYGRGHGVGLINSQGILLLGCKMYNLLSGVVMLECVNVTISKCEIYGFRADAINVAHCANVDILGNYLHDCKADPTKGDHVDFIQFFTNDVASIRTQNIRIEENTINIGTGSYGQSIFMRNELVDQKRACFAAQSYKNIAIRNNKIRNANSHGISIGESDGLTISGNSLTAAAMNPLDAANAAEIARLGGTELDIFVPKIYTSPFSKNTTYTNNTFSGAAFSTGPRFFDTDPGATAPAC
jgi:hypothetical protein